MTQNKATAAALLASEVCRMCGAPGECELCQLHEYDHALALHLIDGIPVREAAQRAHNQVVNTIQDANDRFDNGERYVMEGACNGEN